MRLFSKLLPRSIFYPSIKTFSRPVYGIYIIYIFYNHYDNLCISQVYVMLEIMSTILFIV